MITLITGVPGTGKTALLVKLLLEDLKERPLYVSGIPDLLIPHFDFPDPTKWPTEVPDGGVVVIDEVQRIWRPRGPGQAVPDHVAALETHRHRGLDFYLVTQKPSLLDKNVRGLVGRHLHIRDVGVLGRYLYEWAECSENVAFKSALMKSRYTLPRKVFKLYKSSSMHVKPVRGFPKMLLVLVGAVLGTGYLAWSMVGSIRSRINPEPAVAAAPAAPAPAARTVGLQQVRATGAEAVVSHVEQWTPRVSDQPWTAPAYDALRKVQAVPRIVGGYCVGDLCRCFTQQFTAPVISPQACAEWIKDRPFDPYMPDRPAGAPPAAPAAPMAAASSQDSS